jgi:hypothetical protein
VLENDSNKIQSQGNKKQIVSRKCLPLNTLQFFAFLSYLKQIQNDNLPVVLSGHKSLSFSLREEKRHKLSEDVAEENIYT